MHRLREAVRWSRQRQEPFRRTRLYALKQYVGTHYGEKGAEFRVPVNLMELAVSIYSRQLAARAPRALVTTRVPALRWAVEEFNLALNHVIKEIGLDVHFRRTVMDSLFGLGVMKVGVGPSVGHSSFLVDAGQPFAENVDLDDWVHDMTAKQIDQCLYFGNRYRLPTDAIRESDMFDKGAREAIIPFDVRHGVNEVGDTRANTMTTGGADHLEGEYVSQTELWDIWLPFENLIVTTAANPDGLSTTPLRVVEWDGPEQGPYHMLYYNEVPSNSMPLPPAALWTDLHDLGNRVMRKLARQAERQKSVLGYAGTASDDAERIKEAADGEAVRMDDPTKVQQYVYGGIDQPNLAFLLQIKDMFAYFGGNLDSLGGLGPQSETLGQDQLMSAAASQRVADMQDCVGKFAKGVMEALAFHVWHDPSTQYELEKPVAGSNKRTAPFIFSDETREGDWLDYNIDVEPFSMTHQTPQMRIAALKDAFNTFVMPSAQLLQQVGKMPDMDKVLDMLARDSNQPELRELITSSQGVGVMPTPTGIEKEVSKGSAPTGNKGKYEHIHRSGATRSGKDEVLANALVGSAQQQSQTTGMNRPVG